MDEENRDNWLESLERNACGKSGNRAKRAAKVVDNEEPKHKIPRRGLPIMATDDGEWAIKNKDAHCCLLCGSEVAPIVAPVYAKAGNFFTVVCGSCKGKRYWFRYCASLLLNEITRRDCVERIRRRREQWKSTSKLSRNQ